MKNACQLKYQNVAYIKGLKEVYSSLVLKDGRIAIGNKYLKIYNGKSFIFDFEIPLKNHSDKNDKKYFIFKQLMYLKSGDILINRHHIFFIIKILDKEKKYFILDKFESNRKIGFWVTRYVNYQIIQS